MVSDSISRGFFLTILKKCSIYFTPEYSIPYVKIGRWLNYFITYLNNLHFWLHLKGKRAFLILLWPEKCEEKYSKSSSLC